MVAVEEVGHSIVVVVVHSIVAVEKEAFVHYIVVVDHNIVVVVEDVHNIAVVVVEAGHNIVVAVVVAFAAVVAVAVAFVHNTPVAFSHPVFAVVDYNNNQTDFSVLYNYSPTD